MVDDDHGFCGIDGRIRHINSYTGRLNVENKLVFGFAERNKTNQKGYRGHSKTDEMRFQARRDAIHHDVSEIGDVLIHRVPHHKILQSVRQ